MGNKISGCFTTMHTGMVPPGCKMPTQETEYPTTSIYDIVVKNAKGREMNLNMYKGKVILIVNVASECGLTDENYTELNQLYQKYKDEGFMVLAFPCNQFASQEPGNNEQIQEFVCNRFKCGFPFFDKIDVNGENTASLYKFLKLGKWGFFGDDIQWNFAKFLVDRQGNPVNRYYPTTRPFSLEHDIKQLLAHEC